MYQVLNYVDYPIQQIPGCNNFENIPNNNSFFSNNNNNSNNLNKNMYIPQQPYGYQLPYFVTPISSLQTPQHFIHPIPTQIKKPEVQQKRNIFETTQTQDSPKLQQHHQQHHQQQHQYQQQQQNQQQDLNTSNEFLKLILLKLDVINDQQQKNVKEIQKLKEAFKRTKSPRELKRQKVDNSWFNIPSRSGACNLNNSHEEVYIYPTQVVVKNEPIDEYAQLQPQELDFGPTQLVQVKIEPKDEIDLTILEEEEEQEVEEVEEVEEVDLDLNPCEDDIEEFSDFEYSDKAVPQNEDENIYIKQENSYNEANNDDEYNENNEENEENKEHIENHYNEEIDEENNSYYSSFECPSTLVNKNSPTQNFNPDSESSSSSSNSSTYLSNRPKNWLCWKKIQPLKTFP